MFTFILIISSLAFGVMLFDSVQALTTSYKENGLLAFVGDLFEEIGSLLIVGMLAFLMLASYAILA